MLGMAWGIATVVLLLAYGSGFERGLWIAFRSWGTNLVFVFPGRTSCRPEAPKPAPKSNSRSTIIDYLQAEVPLLKRISPEPSTDHRRLRHPAAAITGQRRVSYYSRMRRMDDRRRQLLHRLSTRTPAAASPSSVPTSRRNCSPDKNALGEKVRLDGISYEVIGVLKHVIQDGDENMNGKSISRSAP